MHIIYIVMIIDKVVADSMAAAANNKRQIDRELNHNRIAAKAEAVTNNFWLVLHSIVQINQLQKKAAYIARQQLTADRFQTHNYRSSTGHQRTHRKRLRHTFTSSQSQNKIMKSAHTSTSTQLANSYLLVMQINHMYHHNTYP